MSNVFKLQLEAVNNMAACKKTCKIREDTHTKKFFFSGRTTKVLPLHQHATFRNFKSIQYGIK